VMTLSRPNAESAFRVFLAAQNLNFIILRLIEYSCNWRKIFTNLGASMVLHGTLLDLLNSSNLIFVDLE
jgi:hypothetical protein